MASANLVRPIVAYIPTGLVRETPMAPAASASDIDWTRNSSMA
jgi:hypothetical protein